MKPYINEFIRQLLLRNIPPQNSVSWNNNHLFLLSVWASQSRLDPATPSSVKLEMLKIGFRSVLRVNLSSTTCYLGHTFFMVIEGVRRASPTEQAHFKPWLVSCPLDPIWPKQVTWPTKIKGKEECSTHSGRERGVNIFWTIIQNSTVEIFSLSLC